MAETTEQYRARINQLKTSIENEPLIKEMRDDIAEGVSKTGNRQADIEVQFQSVIDGTTGKDVISAPEVIVARNGEANLNARLTKKEQQVTAQLAQTNGRLDTIIVDGTPTEGNTMLLDGAVSANGENLGTVGTNIRKTQTGEAIVNGALEPKKLYGNTPTSDFYIDSEVLYESKIDGYQTGKFLRLTNGVVEEVANASYSFSPFIEFENDTNFPLLFSHVRVGTQLILYDENKQPKTAVNFLATETNKTVNLEKNNYKYFRANIFVDYIDTFTVIGGKRSFKYELKWLSIPQNQETSNVGDFLSSMYGKKGYSFGDSIMAQDSKVFAYPSPVYNSHKIGQSCKGYQSLLRERYNVTINDFSVGGQGITEQTLVILSKDYTNIDFVIIACGVNDFSGDVNIGSLPISQLANSEYDATFIGRYFRAISHILSQNPNIKILLMTPLQRDTSYKTDGTGSNIYTTNSVGKKLKDYRNAILDIGDMTGCVVADMYGKSGINKWTLPHYSFEGVHLINEGYEHAMPTVYKAFESL